MMRHIYILLFVFLVVSCATTRRQATMVADSVSVVSSVDDRRTTTNSTERKETKREQTEQVLERIDEQREYIEERFDSLGRLTARITQQARSLTDRNSDHSDTMTEQSVVTIEQIDSLLRLYSSEIVSKEKIKEQIVKKNNLSILEKALMCLSLLFLGVMIFLIWRIRRR